MAKIVKKTEVKKPLLKVEVNLSIDELYIKYFKAKTLDAKLKCYNAINKILSC